MVLTNDLLNTTIWYTTVACTKKRFPLITNSIFLQVESVTTSIIIALTLQYASIIYPWGRDGCDQPEKHVIHLELRVTRWSSDESYRTQSYFVVCFQMTHYFMKLLRINTYISVLCVNKFLEVTCFLNNYLYIILFIVFNNPQMS